MAHTQSVHPDDSLVEDLPPSPLAVTEREQISSDDRLIAMLCYISQLVVPLVLPAIVLLSQNTRERPYQRYHAAQSLALTLALLGLFIVVSLATLIWQIVPLVGALVGLVVLCLSPLAAVGAVVLYLLYGIEAYNGKWFTIPIITPFLRDQGWLPAEKTEDTASSLS